jgi:nitrite reductase (NO-forming)
MHQWLLRLFAIATIAMAPSVVMAQRADHGHVMAPKATASPAKPVLVQASPAPAKPVAPMATMPGMSGGGSDMHAPLVFTLRSGVAEGRMVYIGVGGDIDEKVNPTLTVHEGEVVQVNLINGEGAEHDLVLDQYAARSGRVLGKGASTSLVFTADKTGEFAYFCSVPGHRDAGMEGRLSVLPGSRSAPPAIAQDISRDPADLAAPIRNRPAQVVRVDLETKELMGQLADKTSYDFWTFNGRIPGPFTRVRVGDTVEVHLKNDESSVMVHSVDFHGALGPGGGAEFTQTDPGEEKVVTFKAMVPGLYVYHCATPSVPHHITSGMYGMLLVEPEGGLPVVDREFYVMQGELYTTKPFGTNGHLEMDYNKLMAERPEYFVFNGAVGALTKAHPMRASIGETVRIFFGVGGPNFTSSFHIIGTIFDRVYEGASFISPPLQGVQTVSVPPGGATMVEFKVQRAGRYTMVDHALSRLEHGLVGFLQVDGPSSDEIMHAGPAVKPTH